MMVQIRDCWNSIGVLGDQSCDKLAGHVHCRNCEVYSGAARQLLQRPVGSAYLQDSAARLRQPESASSGADQSLLAFRVGQEWLALPTGVFRAVAPHAEPHALPHRQGKGLLGVVNVSGKLYPAMSLAALLGIDDSGEDSAQASRSAGRHVFPRLLLMEWEAHCFALPVADLYGIVRYASAQVRAPAATINKGLSRFLTGVVAHAGMQVGCLDHGLLGHQLGRLLR